MATVTLGRHSRCYPRAFVSAVLRLRRSETPGHGHPSVAATQRTLRLRAAGILRSLICGSSHGDCGIHPHDFPIFPGRHQHRHGAERGVWDCAGVGIGPGGEAGDGAD